MGKISFYLGLICFFISCSTGNQTYDASGTFEAKEIIVSAEQTGVITQYLVEEGKELEANEVVGQLNVEQLELQKAQVMANIESISDRTVDPKAQIKIFEAQRTAQLAKIEAMVQQKKVLEKEQLRVKNLVDKEAATAKQLDDINGQLAVLEKQIAANQEQLQVIDAQISSTRTNSSLQNKRILGAQKPAEKQQELLEYQIGKGALINPSKGTVLVSYVEQGEFSMTGKPLYKIADLSTMILRAYVTGDQLSLLKIGQEVTISIDHGADDMKTLQGTVSWISSQAEFTPKTIQTRDERANLVYAIKIQVPNDGLIKIGMYGEINF